MREMADEEARGFAFCGLGDAGGGGCAGVGGLPPTGWACSDAAWGLVAIGDDGSVLVPEDLLLVAGDSSRPLSVIGVFVTFVETGETLSSSSPSSSVVSATAARLVCLVCLGCLAFLGCLVFLVVLVLISRWPRVSGSVVRPPRRPRLPAAASSSSVACRRRVLGPADEPTSSSACAMAVAWARNDRRLGPEWGGTESGGGELAVCRVTRRVRLGGSVTASACSSSCGRFRFVGGIARSCEASSRFLVMSCGGPVVQARRWLWSLFHGKRRQDRACVSAWGRLPGVGVCRHVVAAELQESVAGAVARLSRYHVTTHVIRIHNLCIF